MKAVKAEMSGLLETARRDVVRVWNAGAVHIGVSRWLARSVTFAQRLLLARLLGAENIGHIAVVTSSLSLIYLPAGVGAFTVVNKLVAEKAGDESGQSEVLGTSLLVNTLTSVIVGIAAWLILSTTDLISDPVASQMLRILVFFVPFVVYTQVMQNALMGQHRMRRTAGIDATRALVGILLILPMAYLWGVQGWLFNQVLIILVVFGLCAWSLRSLLRLSWNSEVARKIVVIGGFAFLGQLVGTLILQFDTLSVSRILEDPAATGVYNTAALIAQQMLVVPGAILVVVFPFVAQNRRNLPILKKRYSELQRKLGLLVLGMAVVAWISCPWLFSFFGEEFQASVAPFRVLLLGFVARSLYVLDNTYLDALGRTDLSFFSGLLAAGMAIALNLFCIPRWGLMGAAWATTGAMIFSWILRQITVRHFIFYKQAVR